MTKFDFTSISNLMTVVLIATAISCQKSQTKNESDAAKNEKSITLEQAQAEPTKSIDIKTLSPGNQSKYACIQSLCGPEYPFENEYTKKPEKLIEYKSVVEKKIGRKVKLYMGQVIKNELLLNGLMSTLKKIDLSKVEFSKKQIGFINAMSCLYDFDKYTSAIEKNKSDGRLVINAEKLKIAIPGITEQELRAVLSFNGILGTLMAVARPVDELTLQTYIDAVKKSNDISEEATLKTMSDSLLQLRVISQSTFIVPEILSKETTYLIQKTQKMEKLSQLQKIEFVNLYMQNIKISVVLSDVNVLDTFSELPFSKEKLIIDLQSNYQKNIGKIFSDKKLIKPTFSLAESECVTNLAQAYSNSPTQSENQKALDFLSKIVAKTNQLIALKSKNTSADQLRVDFVLPKTNDQALVDWSEIFDGAYTSINEISKFVEKSNYQESTVNSQLLTTLFFKYIQKPEFFVDVLSTCKRTEPAFLTDAANPRKNQFIASWVTVKNLSYGAGIMAHEIGHIVSNKWPNLFTSERICLNSNYGNDQYVEEDFADLFSSKMLNELNVDRPDQRINTTNMICGFPEFKTMNLDQITTSPLINYDSHSAGLYRLLATATNLNMMSNQCSQYLNQYEPQLKVFDNYCKWED